MRKALVVGCAGNVWDDVERAQDICLFDAIYCVKIAGIHWRGSRFVWATLHPEWQQQYQDERKTLGLHMDFETVAPPDSELGTAGKNKRIDRRLSYRYPGMNASASSGGYAAKVALHDGFDRVVLAGIPMRGEDKHFTRQKTWEQRDSFLPGFKLSIPHFAGRVRSMSGLTRELLGEPTREWLGEIPVECGIAG